MTKVREFLGAFSVVAGILMATVSCVFLGSTLMSDFVSMTNVVHALVASAVVSVILAIPMAATGATRRQLGFARQKAA